MQSLQACGNSNVWLQPSNTRVPSIVSYMTPMFSVTCTVSSPFVPLQKLC